jgi:hypothetical protein
MFGLDVTMVLLDIVVIDAPYVLISNVAGDFLICKFNILMVRLVIKKENAVNLIVCVWKNTYCK